MSKKFTSYGGQALIEGVMMRGVDTIAIAVRDGNGEITMKTDEVKGIAKSKIMKIPIIRGMLGLVSSMIVGMKALTYSAEIFAEMDDSYEESKFDLWFKEKFGDKGETILVGISMIFAFVMAFGLFGVLPTFSINFLQARIDNQLVLTIFEGILKIGMFIAYISIISQMKDIKRVFQYHGAEHKAIHCYEAKEELTVENVKKYTTLHPRCGTSFLIIVLVVSIVVFSFVSWSNIFLRIALKVVFLPLIAGISYEIIKLAGKSNHPIVNVISYPGLMMQKLTTNEPDDKQIEVAIRALQEVIDREENGQVVL